MNSRRVTLRASSARLRQTRTMLDARALDPLAIVRFASSVRMGHVPVMAKPARMMAESMVSQPVDAVVSFESVSLCLKA